MAAGEYVSVSSEQRAHLLRGQQGTAGAGEQRRLRAGRAGHHAPARGVSAATARQAAAEISANPEKALAVHALEELRMDPGELPSPVVAAGASLASFAVGAIIPLLPYLFGLDVMAVSLGLAAVAAIVG